MTVTPIELFKRNQRNPIITVKDLPYEANSVFNPGATRLQNGDTLLLLRVEDKRGHSHLTTAISKDGITDWKIDNKPTIVPAINGHLEELWGIEDPRIVYISDIKKYAITYTAYSEVGPAVSLALTKDFKTFERCGVILPPDDKNAALFPHKIGDKWAMLHRPMGVKGGHIWISYSPDMIFWARNKIALESRRGGWWDAAKIGIGPPLIETQYGWLLIYHGVRITGGGVIYRLGLALLDTNNPEKCLLRNDEWIFGPKEEYERIGDVNNVVFPCGYTIGDDGDTINIYYGAADTTVCTAAGKISRLLSSLGIRT